MAILYCKMCGGDVQLSDDKTFGTCEHCGNTMTFPKVSDEQRAALYNRGNHFRRQGEFDKALAVYEQIIREDDTDAEAHWCCALSRFGIEYVEDPTTFEWIPTCHRASFDSFLEDVDYLATVEYSDGVTKKQYQKDAVKIADVQKGILATSQNEEPFDVFICYKESDDIGNRTIDSALAQDIYYQLTDAGYRVFFSRITLEDKAGSEYEPFIFAALNSAKVMVVVGTKKEYLDAVWVKNEWSRYLALMRKDRSRLLLPCYRDMDPYDMPEALSVLQSYDMSKIGFVQDLIRGIKKVLTKEEQTVAVKETVVVQQSGDAGNASALIKRGNMALEDKEWEKADNFFEQVLNQEAECAEAYLGKLMSKCKCSNISSLTQYYISKYEEAEFEELEACAEETSRIENAVSTYLVLDYLSEEEIRKQFEFDRAYTSELSSRNLQKALEMAELSDEKLLVRAQQYASGETKAAIEKMLSEITAVLDKRISDAKNADEGLVTSIKSLYEIHLKDAETKITDLYSTALERQESDYNLIVNQINKAQTILDYEKVRDLFRNMRSYKDAAALADKCQREIDRLKEEERQEAERIENEKRKDTERLIRKKKIIAIISSLIIVAGLVVFSYSEISNRHKYDKGVELIHSGKLEQAYDIFSELDSYRDSKQWAEKAISEKESFETAEEKVKTRNYYEAISIYGNLNYESAETKKEETVRAWEEYVIDLICTEKLDDAEAEISKMRDCSAELNIDKCKDYLMLQRVQSGRDSMTLSEIYNKIIEPYGNNKQEFDNICKYFPFVKTAFELQDTTWKTSEIKPNYEDDYSVDFFLRACLEIKKKTCTLKADYKFTKSGTEMVLYYAEDVDIIFTGNTVSFDQDRRNNCTSYNNGKITFYSKFLRNDQSTFDMEKQ